jgi:hypothetical protein
VKIPQHAQKHFPVSFSEFCRLVLDIEMSRELACRRSRSCQSLSHHMAPNLVRASRPVKDVVIINEMELLAELSCPRGICRYLCKTGN